MRHLVLLIISLCWAGLATAETRLALVIHQQDYTRGLSDVTLAPQEADLIASALREVGFNVTRAANLTKPALVDTLDNFRVKLDLAGPEAVGFIYYTGHGAQNPRSRDSYLLGVNTQLRVGSDFARYGVNLAEQRDAFGATGAKAVFMVFDACRNTPTIPGFKANMKGLNRVSASAEMLIAYSTSLDDLAEEGIYAPILAEEIQRPGQSAEQAFLNAQKRVARLTGQRQKPWSNFQLYNEVVFNLGRNAPPIDQDLADWLRFKPMGVAGAETYLVLHPNGRFAGEARALASGVDSVAGSYIGITVQDMTAEVASALGIENAGAVVTGVETASAASKAGIKQGDVIYEVNAQKVANSTDVAELISRAKDSDTLRLGVLSNGQTRILNVTVVARADDLSQITGEGRNDATTFANVSEGSSRPILGMHLRRLKAEDRSAMGLGEKVGMYVHAVEKGSPAELKGVSAGMALLEIGGQQVDSETAVWNEIEAAQKQKRSTVLATVRSAKVTTFVLIDISTAPDR